MTNRELLALRVGPRLWAWCYPLKRGPFRWLQIGGIRVWGLLMRWKLRQAGLL